MVTLALGSAGAAAPEAQVPEVYTPPAGSEDVDAPRLTKRTRSGAVWERVGDLAVIEGDMIVGRVTPEGRLDRGIGRRGLGHTRAIGRWPDGIVPWEFDPSMDERTRDTVRAAIDHWTTNTRIRFVERTEANADAYLSGYLQFQPTGSCASYVGRADLQPQPLFVQNCTVGSVIHELGHAVGLYHEHTRPDRDTWITVDTAQIQPGREFNFEIQRTNAENIGPYDYDSIMHYGERFFAAGNRPTIIVPPGQAIGQRMALSDGDVRAVDAMYATDLALGAVAQDLGGRHEIDLTIDNLGGLGAHSLELVLELGDGTRWTGITPDSGWDCVPAGAQLHCARETLSETRPQSRFRIEAEPGEGVVPADLRVRLGSRTLDTNLANNVVGGAPALGAAREASAASAPDDGTSYSPGAEPAAATSNGAPAGSPMAVVTDAGAAAAPKAAPAAGGAGAGGSSGPAGLLALVAALGLARRRRAGVSAASG